MRDFSNVISLIKNSRGVYSLDPSMGCSSGIENNQKGCYSDCYAARYSKRHGYNFGNTVLRYFKDEKHRQKIVKEISKVPLSFIRMGTTGDPSENWSHTLDICDAISETWQVQMPFYQNQYSKREIVIITKHWNTLTDQELERLKKLNVCINTSVSALDSNHLLSTGLNEYERIKPFCKSVLRVVTCDFNTNNKEGKRLNEIQKRITSKYKYIDTVFRVSPKNPLVINGVINIHKTKFLGSPCVISKMNKKTYFGNCSNCIEKCGSGDF